MPSPSLTAHDEALLLSLLDANLSLSFLIRHHKMTINQALAWWRQPHIKQALAELTDLSQARAKAIAANDATNAVTALQSCLVLSDTEFYEQADPKTRLRAFESARKAATQVLRLAGMSSAGSSASSCASARAITRGSERVMPRAAPSPKSRRGQATAASARPRPVSTGRGVRGPSMNKPRTERGVPVSEPAYDMSSPRQFAQLRQTPIEPPSTPTTDSPNPARNASIHERPSGARSDKKRLTGTLRAPPAPGPPHPTVQAPPHFGAVSP